MVSFISEKNQKLKSILKKQYPLLSEIKIDKLLKSKSIKINDKRINKNEQVKKGDLITVYFDFDNLSLKVDKVFEDENVLIINKQKKVEVVSSSTDKQTIQSELSKQYPFIKAVHRLDTNTVGLLVFAKNELAYNELLNAFKEKRVQKIYYAIVFGENIRQSESFSDEITKDIETGTSKIMQSEASLNARLSYRLIERKGDLALIEIELETGRTHQIRAQLGFHKIYVLGDGKYGDKLLNRKYKVDYQLLQANQIRFNFTASSPLSYLNEKNFKINFPYNLTKFN